MGYDRLWAIVFECELDAPQRGIISCGVFGNAAGISEITEDS
jgi:hypothetical protein